MMIYKLHSYLLSVIHFIFTWYLPRFFILKYSVVLMHMFLWFADVLLGMRVTPIVYLVSVTWMGLRGQSAPWMASLVPARRTMLATAVTCVPQGITTSQNAPVSSFLCGLFSLRKLVFVLFLTFTAFFSSLVFWFAWLHWILCLTFSACQCETSNGGASDNNCDVETGQCPCQPNFAGKECNQCAHGYFKYPACTCEQYIFSKLLVYSSTQIPCVKRTGSWILRVVTTLLR